MNQMMKIKKQEKKEPTPIFKILELLPHLKEVNKIQNLDDYDNAKFYIIKSFNEENIFKVSSFK